MAKQQQRTNARTQQERKTSTKSSSRSLDDMRNGLRTGDPAGLLPEKWKDLICIVVIFLSLIIFFGKVLDKEHTFNAGDNVASESFKPFVEQAAKDGVSVPQWIPNIFSGMPAFAALVVTGERTNDIVHEIFDVIQQLPMALAGNSDAMAQIWHYFILGLGVYLLLRVGRKTSWLPALFGAFSTMFSTWIITYVMIGHNTKVFAIMTMPYIFLAVEKLRVEKLGWRTAVFWSAILGIAVHFLLESTHMQMVFYIFLALLLYFIVGLVTDLIRKSGVVSTIRAGVIALCMVGLAFAMSADRYMATLGYEPYSIRGSAPIVDTKTDAAKSASSTAGVDKTGGLDWNYATQWSFSPGEMITFIVPAWFGFGKLPYSGSELNVPEGTPVPTYWGQMNGTDAANYTGIVVFFLALIGIVVLWKRDRLVPALAIISLFALILSFGGNLPILFGPMFHAFPMFDKFRAPMMALVLMQLSFPIIAALMLEEVYRVWKNRDRVEGLQLEKYFKYAMIVAGALLVIFLVGRGGFEGSIKSSIAKSGKPYVSTVAALSDLAASTAMNDAMICMFIAALACGLIWWFVKKQSISPLILGLAILLLTVIDLWRVDSRPFDVTTKADYENNFKDHDYDQFIKQDKSLYRVIDMNEPMSNVPVSYGFQTIAGYHAAKMREYQDVVDITGDGGGNAIVNPIMWNLLNTKYIIANGAVSQDQQRFVPVFQSREPAAAGQDGKPGQATLVWMNPQALPRVLLVPKYEIHAPLDILHAMHDGTFDPRQTVMFDKEPAGLGTLPGTPIDTTKERAVVTSYKNESVEIKATAATDRLMFMSDTWYPDWSATIDGKPTTIYKADYAFRAVKVPAGDHTIKFTFEDPRYATGKAISLTANILAIVGLIAGLGSVLTGRKKKEVVVEDEIV